MSSYRVVQVTKRGTLELAERPLVDLKPGQVRIRIDACGICHSDVLAVEGLVPNAEFLASPGMKRSDALTPSERG
jgi:propanol-preferring alcohol dehydrogenase